MNICFVIVNFNDSANTIKLLDTLKTFTHLEKIVVVDNNSQDDSAQVLIKEKSSRVEIILSEKNLGYAGALNKGCRYLCEKYANPYIFLSNTDIEIPSEEVLLKSCALLNEEVKCVMPKIYENGKFKYGWKLTSAGIDLLLNIPLINRPLRKKYTYYNEKYFKNQERCDVDVIYGCFFLIEGETLKNIDYFDEGTFLYYEEYILAKKLRAIGKKSVIDLTSHVNHQHNVTIGTNISKLNKYKIYKQSQIYYEKKYNKANIIEIVLLRIFYYLNLFPYKIKALLKK